MRHFIENQIHYQNAIELVLEKYEVLPVGNGYIDLILPLGLANEFVQALISIDVAVEYITWWCYCTPTSRKTYGCPHGLGGPGFRDGYYSEGVGKDFEVLEKLKIPNDSLKDSKEFAARCNQTVLDYFATDFEKESFYSPCLNPGFWLHVPKTWNRQHYKVN
jgi:hypothetical protein